MLEPASAQPVIIEDGAFIGSRAIIVEGVHIEQEAVIAANVTLHFINSLLLTRKAKELKQIKGRIPARSVVVPGTLEKEK